MIMGFVLRAGGEHPNAQTGGDPMANPLFRMLSNSLFSGVLLPSRAARTPRTLGRGQYRGAVIFRNCAYDVFVPVASSFSMYLSIIEEAYVMNEFTFFLLRKF